MREKPEKSLKDGAKETPDEAKARRLELIGSQLRLTEITEEKDFFKALDMLKKMFADDPSDLDTDESFTELFHARDLARYSFIQDHEGNPVGAQLARINPEIPGTMYIPYMGPLPEHRGLRGAQMFVRVADAFEEQMKELGAEIWLEEVEDPARIGNLHPDKAEEAAAEARGRIHLFETVRDTRYVDDPDAPYIRPATDDDQNTQDYFLFSFRMRDENDSKWKDVFNEDKTAVSREAYRKMYLDLMRLDYADSDGTPTEEELREYPAVERFLTTLDNLPADKQWMRLREKEK